MAEGGFDDIEMRDRKMEEEEYKEAETKFGDEDDPWSIGDYPENFDEGSPKMKFNTVDIPDAIKTPMRLDRRLQGITYAEKIMKFKNIFDIDLNDNAGPYSSILLDETKFRENNKGDISIIYKDRKIANFNYKDGEPKFLKTNKNFVEEFKSNMEKATKEYEKTLDSVIDKEMDWDDYEWDPFVTTFLKDEVKQNSIDSLNSSNEDIQENMKETEMDEQDIRELNGVLDPKGETTEEKIGFLEIQADHWRQKALLETDENKEKWYKDAEKITRRIADKLRLENDLRPKEEETVSIIQQEIEESDIGRFEKFKKWSKENLLGLSAVAISIAGILTTIIIGARNALKSGARAVGNLGKAIANIGKNFGALISSLLNLIGSILAWGAKGITFLAKNLWILTLAITYFFYNEYKERRKK